MLQWNALYGTVWMYTVSYTHLTFIQEHGDFIAIVKRAFHDVEVHYNVEIPVSEIGYIYDYIFKRDSVKAVDDSVNELWETIE